MFERGFNLLNKKWETKRQCNVCPGLVSLRRKYWCLALYNVANVKIRDR